MNTPYIKFYMHQWYQVKGLTAVLREAREGDKKGHVL